MCPDSGEGWWAGTPSPARAAPSLPPHARPKTGLYAGGGVSQAAHTLQQTLHGEEGIEMHNYNSIAMTTWGSHGDPVKLTLQCTVDVQNAKDNNHML